jgi:hypothetical protein
LKAFATHWKEPNHGTAHPRIHRLHSLVYPGRPHGSGQPPPVSASGCGAAAGAALPRNWDMVASGPPDRTLRKK